MQADTLLQTAGALEILVAGPNRIVASLPGGRKVECGPHGLAIFDAFREARTIQAALDQVKGQLVSVTAVAEVMSIIVRLRDQGLLRPPGEPAGGPRTVKGFAGAPIHIAMLDDRTRTSAFLRAIRETVKPGDVVIDLGTGTGVLAIGAAQAGARQVYAIEASAVADVAAAMFDASGVGHRISLVREWSTDAVLDERADVLVTETLGNDPWAEGVVHLVSDARRRLLKPDARIIPSRVRWLAQPVTVPPAEQARLRFSTDAARRWTEWYGIDLTSVMTARDTHAGIAQRSLGDVVEWPRPCPAIVLGEVDLIQGGRPPADITETTVATCDGVVDGVVLCWEAELAPGVRLSTVPGAAGPDSHWRNALLLAPESCDVRAGDALILSLTAGHPSRVALAVQPQR